MMRIQQIVSGVLRLFVLAFWASEAPGQNFPNKPIRIITSEPGGGADFVSRVMAHGLAANLGQQVLVENRGAASGVAAAQIVTRAAPDGYTLLFYPNGIWLLPFMRDDVPYDPVADFSPVTLAVRAPNVLVVNPSVPANSVRELIALAHAQPGKLNYGAGAAGSSPHLAAELFKAMASVDIVRINYKGGAAALNDLIGGQVQIMFPVVGTAASHIKTGRLKGLAVTGAQQSALLPGLSTVAAAGVPGYETGSVYGLFAPARTPQAVIRLLNQQIVQVLNRADAKEKFFAAGVEVEGSSPEQFAMAIKSEMSSMGKLIRDAGIRGE